MTTKDEALKLALEALELSNVNHWWGSSSIEKAITTIREALVEQPAQQHHCNDCGGFDPECPLAQPAQQQEPVAYTRKDQLQKAAQSPMLCEVTPEPRQDRIGIYTSPPASKPWVGLTDEERQACTQSPFTAENYLTIETKLREKNT